MTFVNFATSHELDKKMYILRQTSLGFGQCTLLLGESENMVETHYEINMKIVVSDGNS
jgi:hypothetical protein